MRARASSVGFVGRASATRIILAAWPSSEPGAGCDRRLAGLPNSRRSRGAGERSRGSTSVSALDSRPRLACVVENAGKENGRALDQAGIPLKFAPETGPEFFTRCGWEPEQIHSVMHGAAKIKRLPLFLRLLAMIFPARFQPNRPWSGVCLMGRSGR